MACVRYRPKVLPPDFLYLEQELSQLSRGTLGQFFKKEFLEVFPVCPKRYWLVSTGQSDICQGHDFEGYLNVVKHHELRKHFRRLC